MLVQVSHPPNWYTAQVKVFAWMRASTNLITPSKQPESSKTMKVKEYNAYKMQ